MTWPQYRRRQCVLNGRVVSLTPFMLELISLLLMRRGQIVSYEHTIEVVWPDPDRSPLAERAVLTSQLTHLRKRLPGVVAVYHGRGLCIPVLTECAVRRAA